jgi:cytochrome o ubiquinol oxidase subunit 1
MPRNTASGIYISIFAFLVGFGFVWEITWLVVAAFAGIIISVIMRTFNENTEYTITAEEVEKMEIARKKSLEAHHWKNANSGEDMGLWEFVRIVLAWALGLIRRKR